MVRAMLKEGGVKSLFKGLTSTWCREVPGYFAFFYGYEATRGFLTPAGKSKDDIGEFLVHLQNI